MQHGPTQLPASPQEFELHTSGAEPGVEDSPSKSQLYPKGIPPEPGLSCQF